MADIPLDGVRNPGGGESINLGKDTHPLDPARVTVRETRVKTWGVGRGGAPAP